jgi:hypothetical protein
MVIGLVVYYVAIELIASLLVIYLSWGIPALGAAVAAFLAPRSKFNVGAATVFLAVLVIGVGGYIAGELGIGDSVGVKGTVIFMVLSAPYIAVSSVCGALLGEWVSRRLANA